MKSDRVVEGAHVIEGEELELIWGGDAFSGEAFGFEGGPERLHESVVVAVALAAHALGDLTESELGTELPAGILDAAI